MVSWPLRNLQQLFMQWPETMEQGHCDPIGKRSWCWRCLSCFHFFIHVFIHYFILWFFHFFIRSFFHSFFRSFFHSFIRSFFLSFFHSLILSFFHSFIRSFFDSLILSSFHSGNHSNIHFSIPSFSPSVIHSVIPLFSHSFSNSFIHSLIHSFNQSFIHVSFIHALSLPSALDLSFIDQNNPISHVFSGRTVATTGAGAGGSGVFSHAFRSMIVHRGLLQVATRLHNL